MLMGMILRFFPLVLKQVNVVVVATASMIRMHNCVFLMLLKVQAFNLMSRTNETKSGMKRVSVNVD